MFIHLQDLRRRLHSRSHRGVSAVEFGLVAPILVTMVLAIVDYGWFFSREAMITSSLEGAVRAGGNVSPGMNESAGACAQCVLTAESYAVAALRQIGLDVDANDIDPSIINVEGTCAIQICPSVQFEPLIGLVPLPDTFGVCAIALAQTVEGC